MKNSLQVVPTSVASIPSESESFNAKQPYHGNNWFPPLPSTLYHGESSSSALRCGEPSTSTFGDIETPRNTTPVHCRGSELFDSSFRRTYGEMSHWQAPPSPSTSTPYHRGPSLETHHIAPSSSTLAARHDAPSNSTSRSAARGGDQPVYTVGYEAQAWDSSSELRQSVAPDSSPQRSLQHK